MPFENHPVFVPPRAGQLLWRFMDFPRYYFLMARRQLYMPSLARLTNDPWEGLPPKSYFDPKRRIVVHEVESAAALDLQKVQKTSVMEQADLFGGEERFRAHVQSSIEGYRRLKEQVFVSCWHMNDVESEALWQIYGGRGYGIAVRSTYERLSQALKHDGEIYGGVVKYIDETDEPIGNNNIFYNCLWKRRSFAHEEEFRVVAMKNTACAGIPVPLDLSALIEEIVVHPSADQWFFEIVTDIAESSGCGSRTRRSTLLNEPNYDWPLRPG